MTPSAKCLVEMKQLNFLAGDFAAKGNHEKARELRARAEQLGNCGLSSDELRAKYVTGLLDETGQRKITQASPEYRDAFYHYVRTGEVKPELRDVLVGGGGDMSISYTQGAQGGYVVPIETEARMFEALAQTDPLLSDKVVDFWMSPTPYLLRPHVLTGVDLSAVSAVQVAETNQHLTDNVPTVAATPAMRGNIGYVFSLGASLEADVDIPNWMEKFARIAGVAFARRLGKDAAIGNGSTNVPRGLFSFLGPSSGTVGTGTEPTGGQATPNITAQDLNAIYFSVNRVYRNMPKAGWLCSDAVYQKIRNAVDNMGRPLIDMEGDSERLLGKPLYVSPSMSNALSSEGAGVLIFGDLDHFHVRVSKPWFMRAINEASIADITQGKCLYTARIKMDSAYFDPSAGGSSPIVWFAVHS